MEFLTGTIQNYDWGTSDGIADLLGRSPDGQPQAEYWLGAHPKSPSQVGDRPLDAVIAEDPAQLGEASRQQFGDRLPYLMKILSAERALSLQAHPSRAQAEEGYAREEEQGIAADARERTYKDSWPKPEMIVSLGEMHALCGFREPRAAADLFGGLGLADRLSTVLGPLTERKGAAALAETFLDALSLTGERAGLINELLVAAVEHAQDRGPVGEFARTAIELDASYPGDPGILAALLLNRVTLQQGQAIFLPAGNLHAYLRGTGVEIMANSDNVLRGGLTSKHIDVAELTKVVDFSPYAPPILTPVEEAPGVRRYPTPAPEFALRCLDEVEAELPAESSARILLVLDGSYTATGAAGELTVAKGQSIYLPAGEQVRLAGAGTAFLAAHGIN
ncbi:mannose-6-phosphate isomerase, class I [Parenemella sanctibonifatiensis]|uniref:mannose-6-phosphate isomerase n=1 Tax=Parenemella sanctibonifatiensis TaxID=2016505 RepID=A0A255DZT6_9ACTN|nr:mannose-6-phosphate isomerase, class I [Parenemella sanctibonifatiensis]OYN84756.1 mannose-6-phosphate isomerase, class I [Parenemella sanctibonifatiensis]